MRRRVVTPLTVALVMIATSPVPLRVAGQSPPPSALVNQRSAETLEAARAASPHTAESTFAYFEDEVAASLAAALERVWDPTQPREPSPRTAWGDPDVSGYWLSATYTPLQRPEALAGRPLYTPEEAIQVHRRGVLGDAAADPATVHYDWTEFGMDNWQSPIRPNRRTSLIVDPPDGRMPAYTAEGRARLQVQARRHTLESRGLFERCIQGTGPPRLPGSQQIGEAQIVQTEITCCSFCRPTVTCASSRWTDARRSPTTFGAGWDRPAGTSRATRWWSRQRPFITAANTAVRRATCTWWSASPG